MSNPKYHPDGTGARDADGKLLSGAKPMQKRDRTPAAAPVDKATETTAPKENKKDAPK